MFSSVLRALALLYESSYSLIRMRPYMLIALFCMRFLDIDIGNHGVRKTGFGHVKEDLVLWNILSVCFNLFCNVWVFW
jgi:hypothetical protein